jgi:hypothetical protein
MQFHLRTLILLTILQTLPILAQEKGDPSKPVQGEWEIVGMIYKGKVQDSGGLPLGWIKFEKDGFAIADGRHSYGSTFPCTIRREEIDILDKSFGPEKTLRALYAFQNEELWIVWANDYGNRPTHFDAPKDPRLTLYVLRKAN